jgi:quercetin dioxygenase-like cupin family protein
MALKHAISGEIVNLLTPGESPTAISQALVSTPEIELMRLVLKAGKHVPVHAVAGPITLYCHEGAVEVLVENSTKTMNANDLMYLEGRSDHALHAVTDSIVLVTIFRVPGSVR